MHARTGGSSPTANSIRQTVRHASSRPSSPPGPEDVHNTAISRKFPFRLNTGRVRDQWHTMTRSGMSPRLGAHAPEPFVEVHPLDATAANRTDGTCQVATRCGSCVLKVSRQRPAAPRLAVRSHSLERCDGFGRAHRRPGDARDRPSFRPARRQGHAGIDRAGPFGSEASCSRAAHRPADGTWWARVALAQASGLLLATNDGSRFLARHRAACSGTTLAEYADELRHLPRRRVLAG